MKKLLLFPANGNAIEAIEALGNDIELIGFVDDDKAKQGKEILGFPVLSRDAFESYPDAYVLAVPGSPDTFKDRERVIKGLHLDGNRFISIIHPSSSISKNASIGKNVFIQAGCTVTSDAKISDHVVILPGCIVHHGCIVGEYAMLGAQTVLSGSVNIKKNCYLGAGARVKNGVTIEKNTLVGMGSVVIKNLKSDITVAGVPAQELN